MSSSTGFGCNLAWYLHIRSGRKAPPDKRSIDRIRTDKVDNSKMFGRNAHM